MNLISRLLREIRAHPPARERGGPDANRIRELVAAGRADEARSWLREKLAEDPGDLDSLQLLGLVQLATGDHADAARLIGRAVERAPEVSFLRSNLAKATAKLGRLDEAEIHFREAARLAPEALEAQVDLAMFLIGRGKTDDGLRSVRQLLDVDRRNRAGRSLEATALAAKGLLPEAISRLKEALADFPDDPMISIQLFMLQAGACDWSGDRKALARIIEQWAAAPMDRRFDGLHPFVAWHVQAPAAARLAITQGYLNRLLEQSGPPVPRRNARELHGARPLRLGYLSADFHHHPTMRLIGGLFGRHDRGRFEVYAYSLGPDDGSEARKNAIAAADRFVDLRNASVRDCAQRIASDRVDVLIDLKGYTLDARPEIIALRPAPLQLSWLGYPATLGSGLVDYAVVDATVAPRTGSSEFGEALIRLPCCYQIADEAPVAPAPERRELGLPESGTVFACFNASYKIEPAIYTAWMRILTRVPASVLWLYCGSEWGEANLRREASVRGVDPARIVFGGTLPRPDHLGRLKRADLLLDTHFINAHTGAADAMWAGVPLLTFPGSGFASRVAASVLRAAGLPELVCDHLSAYEHTAVSLAHSPRILADLRRRLEERTGPYFDSGRMLEDLQRAIEMAWRRYVDGVAPSDFDVPG